MPRVAKIEIHICEVCKQQFHRKIIKRKKRTCSNTCATRLRAIGSQSTQSRKITLVCAECGKTKLVSPVYRDRQYCSRVCSYRAMSGPGSSKWQGGVTSERRAFYTSTDWGAISKAVWVRDNAICQRCGERHKYNDPRFEVHHIAGFARFPELRLSLENLVLLCGRCHRFIHSKQNTESIFVHR